MEIKNNIYKAQNNQDFYILENLFKDQQGQIKTDGYFVDIGAHDGIEASASYAFEKLGWDGICIEPLPQQFNRLKNNRTVECVHAAISDLDSDNVEFLEVIGNGYIEMLSGIKEKLTDGHIGRIDWESSKPEYHNTTKKVIHVPNYTFNKLISRTHIDFLSIDTEGSDHEILNSIDFNKYQIDVICFEDNGCAYEHKISHAITNTDFVDKYLLIGRIIQDYILVHKNYLKTLPNTTLSREGLTDYYL